MMRHADLRRATRTRAMLRGLAVAITALGVSAPSAALGQQSEAERYQRFLQAQEERFTGFLSAQDSAFASYLDRQWKQMEGGGARRAYSAPKIVAPPRRDSATAPAVMPAPAPAAVPAPAPAALPTPAPTARVGMLAVPFFGTSVELRHPEVEIPDLQSPVDGKAIAAFYRAVAALDWSSVQVDLQGRASSMALDDYAYAQVLLQMARRLAGDEQRARLLTWYLLLQTKVDARVAYVGRDGGTAGLAQGTVVLLVPSTVMVYNAPYFTFGQQRYYALSLEAGPAPERLGQLYTYEGSHPGEPRRLDLRIARTPELGVAAGLRRLEWTYGDSTYTLDVQADRHAVQYLEWFPQVEWDVWFGIAMSAPARATLLPPLRKMLAGRSEREQVDFLLRFVQTAFAYQTDAEQFGREKPMSVDETLLYPASDCEDRAILFTALVRELIGLEVVALQYPGHLATALRLREAGAGETVTVAGVTWTVADPTYIGGKVGEVMPQFRGMTPEVIRVR